MSRLENIAVAAIIGALAKLGETILDGNRQDDFADIIKALTSLFDIDDKDECKDVVATDTVKKEEEE